tara:strand:+ start:203 stop:355 length:153 start_codon:yes stop_codon:yes gene_type:complete
MAEKDKKTDVKSKPEKKDADVAKPKEFGGRSGPEPTRYGDWENNGIISDF